MQDLKSIQKQIEKNNDNAQTARRQADVERNKANTYNTGTDLGNRQLHEQEAQKYDAQAMQLESDNQALQPKLAEVEARITELKTQRETLNRETLEKITAIDKELVGLQGSMTI